MSDTFQIEGRIIRIDEPQTIGSSGFRKRVFILDTADEGAKYPNELAFELHKDQCDIHLSMGPALVRFAINGRPWKDRHFVTLKAFSVARVNDPNDPNDSKPMPEARPDRPPVQSGADEDLPF